MKNMQQLQKIEAHFYSTGSKKLYYTLHLRRRVDSSIPSHCLDSQVTSHFDVRVNSSASILTTSDRPFFFVRGGKEGGVGRKPQLTCCIALLDISPQEVLLRM